MKSSAGIFSRFEDVLSHISGAALFLMMILVAVDVAMRYIFNQPLAFVNEVVSLYLLAIVFFLALPGTSRSRGNISVDVLKNRMSTAARRICEAFGSLVGLVLFGAIGWLGALRALDSFLNNDRLLGFVAWPVWTAEALVPIGCATLCIRLGISVAGHVMSAVTGVSHIPEPQIDAEQENLE